MRGVEGLIAAFGRVADASKIEGERATNEIAQGVVGQARLNASARPGPEVRTGNLRRSIDADPAVTLGAGLFGARTYVGVIYARLQERGGDVYARHMTAMWDDMVDWRNWNWRTRDIQGSDFGREPSGLAVDAQRHFMPGFLRFGAGSHSSYGPVTYARHVRIPARPYFEPALIEMDHRKNRIMAEHLRVAFASGG